MHRILIVALALIPMTLLGCGARGNAAADDAWNGYKAEKIAKANAGYEAGMALHAKYMADAPKPEYGPYDAMGWYATQEENLAKIDAQFAPVHLSDFQEKIFLTYHAMGQGWDKLAMELDALNKKGAPGRPADKAAPQKVRINIEFAIDYALTYYTRVANDYAEDQPAMVKTHADKIAEANARIGVLKAFRKRNEKW